VINRQKIANRFLQLTCTVCACLVLVSCGDEDGYPVGSFLNRTKIGVYQWQAVSRHFHGITLENIIIGPNSSLLVSVRDSGVFVSQNIGTSWQDFSQGLPDGHYFNNMAISTNDVLVGADDSVIYIRTSSGEGWKRMMEGIPSGAVLNGLDYNGNGQAYANTSTGLFLLNSNNDMWISLADGLPASASILDLDFGSSGNTVALTASGALYRSQNGIDAWSSVFIPYYIDSAYAIAINPQGDINMLLNSRRLVILKNGSDEEPVQLVFGEDVRYYNGIGYLEQAQEKDRDPYINDIARYRLMRSIDGGKNWVVFHSGISGFVTDFTFDSHGNGFVVTADGTLYQTINPVN
jgi:photosynthesis system II assembly factor YCF48-like protein